MQRKYQCSTPLQRKYQCSTERQKKKKISPVLTHRAEQRGGGGAEEADCGAEGGGGEEEEGGRGRGQTHTGGGSPYPAYGGVWCHHRMAVVGWRMAAHGAPAVRDVRYRSALGHSTIRAFGTEIGYACSTTVGYACGTEGGYPNSTEVVDTGTRRRWSRQSAIR
eukprot:1252412-Rhodomonas_salina.2